MDRLVHRSEILAIDGESYRFKEAQEQAAAKAALRENRNDPGSDHETQRYGAGMPTPGAVCDADVATLLQFLYDLTEALERHYTAELIRRNYPAQDGPDLHSARGRRHRETVVADPLQNPLLNSTHARTDEGSCTSTGVGPIRAAMYVFALSE